MRREEKKRQKRQRILDAAVQIFARKGFHETRISDVAEEAKIGHGTVYLYFETKEEILVTIYDEVLGDALRAVKEVAETGKNAMAKLTLFAGAIVKLVAENRALSELLMLETPIRSKILDSESAGQMSAYVHELVKQGVKEGIFRADFPTDIIAECLYSGMERALMRWLLTSNGPDGGVAVRAVLDVALRGLINPKATLA